MPWSYPGVLAQRAGSRSDTAASALFVGRLKEFAGTFQVSGRDVHVSRAGRTKFGAADNALRLRLNARLCETLAEQLRLSFVRRGGDNAQLRAGLLIRLSHDRTSERGWWGVLPSLPIRT